MFATSGDVAQALKNAQKDELYNVQFLVETILEDLKVHEKATKKSCRLVLVLDESGQWIEDDAGRLAQLQALVEEAAQRGQGKIWVFVTTHEDMGSIYQNARALRGDMKKIEGRFRFKFSLTTENIELVLEDRLLKQTLAGQAEVADDYNENPGVLRDLGQLANTSQKLPECSWTGSSTFYPFFPYQIHLIPEIVKSLRMRLAVAASSSPDRPGPSWRSPKTSFASAAAATSTRPSARWSASTRSTTTSPARARSTPRSARTQPDRADRARRDPLHAARRRGAVPDPRDHFVPRTLDNLARLLVEHTSDDLARSSARIRPELDRLIKAKLVAPIGEEYEFLTGERQDLRGRRRSRRCRRSAGRTWKPGSSRSPHPTSSVSKRYRSASTSFPVQITLDGNRVYEGRPRRGPDHAPSGCTGGNEGHRPGGPEPATRECTDDLRALRSRSPGFEQDLKRFLAMSRVVRQPGKATLPEHKRPTTSPPTASRQTSSRSEKESPTASATACGEARSSSKVRPARSAEVGQTPGEALRADLRQLLADALPEVRQGARPVVNEQKAVLDVLKGAKDLTPTSAN